MRHYYKDFDGNYYNLDTKRTDLIEISEQDFNDHINFLKGLVKKDRIDKELEITELKSKLSATDYQAIKYAEGQLTADEYAPIKAQRQAWREQINALEGELANG